MKRGVVLLTALAVGAVGVVVAVPDLVRARKHGNEGASIGAIKSLATAEAIFREGDKGDDWNLDYGMLGEIRGAPTVDSALGPGTKQGYVWSASPANQAGPGTTGDRYFTTNHAGVIYYTGGRPLTLDTSTSVLPNNSVISTEGPDRPENPFRVARGPDATSTFSVDVDTASYALVGRYLRHRTLPPPELVRIEELLNRFDPTDPLPPTDGRPFATRVEVADCPWRAGHELVRIALRGREIDETRRPPTNLVFLIDVSGSMEPAERLPLLKQALRLLVARLGERDRVSIVAYAGAAGLVLPPTCGASHERILAAIDSLAASGSTNGGAGVELAYRTAIESFVESGSNRVILCTDGDFNVGLANVTELERFIAEKRRTGVFLSALGFGADREGDRIMRTLADRGNGCYSAIENLPDARRVLVKEANGTLFTIAKDVKVQVEWNPERVKGWRLVGYEKRALAASDFKDDAKDAGEIGAGHRVTALYEVEPADGAPATAPLLTLRLRWKAPDSETCTGTEVVVRDRASPFADASPDLRFAASVAAGGMLLRRSPHAGDATWDRAIEWAAAGLAGRDERAEWIQLLRIAAVLSPSG